MFFWFRNYNQSSLAAVLEISSWEFHRETHLKPWSQCAWYFDQHIDFNLCLFLLKPFDCWLEPLRISNPFVRAFSFITCSGCKPPIYFRWKACQHFTDMIFRASCAGSFPQHNSADACDGISDIHSISEHWSSGSDVPPRFWSMLSRRNFICLWQLLERVEALRIPSFAFWASWAARSMMGVGNRS